MICLVRMKIWKTISVFLGGIIAGLLIAMKLRPATEINAVNYNDQEIKKAKVRGRDNTLEISTKPKLTRAEKRKARLNRKAKRKAKKS